ncbi:MAG: MFS transporter, partial [Chloroflexota bacterium]
PSIFLINLPVCAVILGLLPRYMVEPGIERQPSASFDVVGAALFAAALALAFYGVIAAAEGGWGAPGAAGSLATGAALALAFVWTETRAPHPMVDLQLFRNVGFSAGNLAKVCAYLSFAANNFLLPFYLYRALDLTPAETGVRLSLLPIGMFIASLYFGPLSDKIGTCRLAPTGMALLVMASVLLAVVDPTQGFLMVAAAMVLAGVGLGAFIAPNDSAILSVVPSGRLGVANGVMGVSRSLGMLSGQTLAGGLLSARLAANRGAFLASFHETYAAVATVTALGIAFAAVRSRGSAGARGPG